MSSFNWVRSGGFALSEDGWMISGSDDRGFDVFDCHSIWIGHAATRVEAERMAR